jgi:hypothetical protein
MELKRKMKKATETAATEGTTTAAEDTSGTGGSAAESKKTK